AERTRHLDGRMTDPAGAARRRFGNPLQLQELSRDQWGFAPMEQFVQDIRHALRRLRQRPGLTAAILAALTLGVGATTRMFSAVAAAMLRPLPFALPDELLALHMINLPFDPGPGQPKFPSFGLPDFNELSRTPSLFSHVAAYAPGGLNLSDPV